MGLRLWFSIAVCLGAAYLHFFVHVPEYPFLDLPNHIARAFLISELPSDPRLQQWFLFEFKLVPYIFGDAILVSLVKRFGTSTATVLWVCLSFIGFVLSVCYYARQVGLRGNGLRVAEFLSLFLATNWFFLNAFSHFVVGCITSFFSLGLLHSVLNRSSTSSLPWVRIACYSIVVILTFLTHLAAAIFAGLITLTVVCVRLYERKLSLVRAAIIMIPHAVTGSWYIALTITRERSYAGWEFRPLWEKLTAMGATLVRYNQWTDIALTMFFLLILLLFHRTSQRERASKEYLEYGIVTFVLLCAYAFLPVAVNTLSDIDTRALPFLSVAIVLAACAAAKDQIGSAKPVAAAAILAGLNLYYLVSYIQPQSRILQGYEAAFDSLPPYAKVFSVNTRPDVGRMQGSLHAAMGAVPERRVIVPYILSSNQGEPVTYFHYRTKLYEPYKFWYLRDGSVDWSRIRQEYDFVLVTKPYNIERIELPHEQLTFENDFVVLYDLRSTSRQTAYTALEVYDGNPS